VKEGREEIKEMKSIIAAAIRKDRRAIMVVTGNTINNNLKKENYGKKYKR
jgi:hypothetical protein